MISSGRSFTFSPSLPGDELVAETLQPAAHAGVHAQRTGLEDHAADQLGVDLARCLDRAAGGLLDLRHDRGGLVVGQLESGGQLDRDASLRAVDERLELVADPGNLPGTTLRCDQAEEVVDELVGARGELAEDADLGGGLDLWVREERSQLGGSRRRQSANSPRSRCTASRRPCSSAAWKRARAYRRSATATAF